MSYGNYGGGGYGQGGDGGDRYGGGGGGGPYGQQGGNPYGQPASNPYGSSQYGQQSYGGSQSAQGQQSGQYAQGNDVELGPINGQSGPGAGGADPNAILNECRGIDQGIDTIEQSLRDIERLHAQARGDTGGQSSLGRAIDEKGTTTMGLYRNLAARVKKVKSLPESGSPKNAPQVGRVDRRLKAAINKYQTLDRDYRRQLQSDMARQYKIVRPDASEAEVREAVEDTSNQQIFSQALMQSDRRGNAQGTYARVNERHEEIQKIERQMIELAELFQDMEALVVQQEPLVERIEEQGTVVNEDVGKANVEIAGAIEKARSRNRKKWWCLLIVLLIIIVVVVVAVVVTVINKQKKV